MAAYLILNLVFSLVVLLVLRVRIAQLSKAHLYTLIALLLLTAVFDNCIVMLSIVGYDVSKLLHIYIYKAPVEDFMYPLLGVVLVPAIWRKLGAATNE